MGRGAVGFAGWSAVTLYKILQADESTYDGALDARAHRETLYATENEAKARLRVTFEQACDHLDEAEPRLTLLYAKQPALVKSFFYTKPKGE